MEHSAQEDFAERVRANQYRLAFDIRGEFDYIVCGAGTSGSVVAARLAANPSVRVLLLEAGCNVCALLAKTPRWQAALAAEASELDLLPEEAATNLPNLVLTRAVVREALRLYPPAFMTGRLAKQTHEICGSRVETGAIILSPLWLLHTNARWWAESAVFNPGRFPGDAEPERFMSLPFGAGPHVCIGAQLALSVATLVTARSVQKFSVAIRGDRAVLPVGTLSTRPGPRPDLHLAALRIRQPSVKAPPVKQLTSVRAHVQRSTRDHQNFKPLRCQRMTDRYQLPTLHVACRSTFNPLRKAANDNQLAWPLIQFPEGWNAAC